MAEKSKLSLNWDCDSEECKNLGVEDSVFYILTKDELKTMIEKGFVSKTITIKCVVCGKEYEKVI